jgi:hypothetical protein
VALIYGLSQMGKIDIPPREHGVSDPDSIYTSRIGNGSVVVEVTAVSDEAKHERNPIHDFLHQITARAQKAKLHSFGAFSVEAGHVERNRDIILSVPERKDFAQFFADRKFKCFFNEIRRAPMVRHEFVFAARGGACKIVFESGGKFAGASYRSYIEDSSLSNNAVANRLASKAKQARKARTNLPTVLILCDGGCVSMRSSRMRGGAPTAIQTADLFLNGHPGYKAAGRDVYLHRVGPRTSRFAAVLCVGVQSTSGGGGARIDRTTEWGYVLGSSAYPPVTLELLKEIAGSAYFFPRFRSSPEGARSFYPRPDHWGGYQLSQGKTMTKVRLSALTLQGLLSGEISHKEFSESHQEIVREILNAKEGGRMLSSALFVSTPDDDDDWVELELRQTHPAKLIENIGSDRD